MLFLFLKVAQKRLKAFCVMLVCLFHKVNRSDVISWFAQVETVSAHLTSIKTVLDSLNYFSKWSASPPE